MVISALTGTLVGGSWSTVVISYRLQDALHAESNQRHELELRIANTESLVADLCNLAMHQPAPHLRPALCPTTN